MRHEYENRGLDEDDLDPDPLVQFDQWLADAVRAELPEPNAMVVATVGEDGAPTARHVLLKGISDGGFEFFTNYGSAKGRAMDNQPAVALTFGWLGLHRQVCVEGVAERLTPEESDAYFAVRPRGSQLGTWVSKQSAVISGRVELDQGEHAAAARFPYDVPRPPHWGGYRVRPRSIEFWQGRPSRLHDRLRYRLDADGRWIVERLAP